MPVKVRDIVAAVQNELSQVPGIATQLYSTGRIQQHVQDAFLLEFDDFWWPQYMTYAQTNADGQTGSLTTDLVGPLGPISGYEDIQSVWPAASDRKLREVPQSVNPFSFVGASNAVYMYPDYSAPNRPFKVIPTSYGSGLVVHGRQRPKLPFGLDDLIYLDMLMLQYDAAWMYCVDDGTVPAQVNKFQVLAQKRRTLVKSNFANIPVPLDPRYHDDYTAIAADTSPFVMDQDPLA